jgi:hypothetical protein
LLGRSRLRRKRGRLFLRLAWRSQSEPFEMAFAERTTGASSFGLTPSSFFERDSGESGLSSPVQALREGRLRVAKYDVAIIGSGPGGYVSAIRAGELGLKTVVVEKDPFLGGTCLHVGCIPTKVLLHHAEVYDHFKNGEELGFEVSGLKINWANILARKDKIVKKHSKGIEFLFKKNKVASGD